MTRTRKALAISLAAVAVGGLVAANLVRSREPRREVELEQVRRRDLRSVVTGSGWIEPHRKVEVSASTAGKVIELAVEEGDTVAAGQLLLRIDPTPFRGQVDRLKAAIAAARADRAAAEATLAETTTERARTEALAARHLASGTELEAVRRREERAAAGVAAANGRLDQEEALLRTAEYDLEQVTIAATMAGVITRLNIEEGETVVTGTMNNPGTVLLIISDLSAMEARVEVDETDVVHVAVGQEAEVTVDAFPDTTLRAVVSEVGSSAARAGGRAGESSADFDVVVRLTDTLPGLRPGLSATADIVAARRTAVLAVSIGALVYRDPQVEARRAERRKRSGAAAAAREAAEDTLELDGGAKRRRETYGILVVENGRTRFLPVTIGITGERHIELTGGAAEGTEVVAGPFKTLRELHAGDLVKRAPAKRKDEEKGGGKQAEE